MSSQAAAYPTRALQETPSGRAADARRARSRKHYGLPIRRPIVPFSPALSYEQVAVSSWRPSRTSLIRESADNACNHSFAHEIVRGDATEPEHPDRTGTRHRLPAARQDPCGTTGGNDPDPALPRSAMSDAALLRLHVDGDPDAFGELFLRHKDRLWAVAIRTLADPEDAADALQDAMISAFRRADSFRGESAVTTWLHRIVVNACLDRMRRRSARPEVSGGDERLLDLAASGDTRPDHAAGSETSIDVMAALRQLPYDQQVAIVLIDMLEYPVADAAQMLGVAQGTVKSRCARGRARLLPKLAHLREFARDRVLDGNQAGQRPPAGPANPAWPAAPVIDSEPPARNRIRPGSVLPAQKGGDKRE
jgi:RNA polymerase sigma-70 factor, ECF subfamily